MDIWCDAVETHYRSFWGREGEVCPFAAGPVNDLPADFRVLRYPPTATRTMWTYATVGMSARDDASGVELHMFADTAAPELVELLFAVAHYHRTETLLGLGHTVNFGKPWRSGSSCSRGLVSLPYLDGPALELADIFDRPVRCLWLIPITESELAYKTANGLEALERKFDEQPFDYARAQRPGVV